MSTASIIIRSIASQVLLSYTCDDRGLSDVIGKISSWPGQQEVLILRSKEGVRVGANNSDCSGIFQKYNLRKIGLT